MNPLRVLAVVLVAAVVLAGCAAPTGSADPSTPGGTGTSSAPVPAPGATSSSPARSPSTGPLPIPSTPSDQLPGGVVVGTVTAASSGPCYLVETDEGRSYALYGTGGTLARGQRVKVHTGPLTGPVSCGPGTQVAIVKLELSG